MTDHGRTELVRRLEGLRRVVKEGAADLYEIARWLVKLMNEQHRDRYGKEMLELLHHSSRPTGDLINVAAYVLRWHMEAALREPLIIVAAILAAVSFFAGGYVVAELADGLTELHKHWWSTLPSLGLLLAAGLVVTARTQGSVRDDQG